MTYGPGDQGKFFYPKRIVTLKGHLMAIVFKIRLPLKTDWKNYFLEKKNPKKLFLGRFLIYTFALR